MQEGAPRQPQKQEKKPLTQNLLTTKELNELPKQEKKELIEKTGQETLNFFRTHATEYTDINKMYDALRGEPLIVRREDPERIIDALNNDESYSIDFPEGERYSNAVVWSGEQGVSGLNNAYLEGYGQVNGIVTVVGVKQEALHDVEAMDDAEQRFAGLDRTHVRSVKGEIGPKDIVFVTVRIPSIAFSEEEMSDSEYDRFDSYKQQLEQFAAAKASGKEPKLPTPQFIHRGYLFTDNLSKQ